MYSTLHLDSERPAQLRSSPSGATLALGGARRKSPPRSDGRPAGSALASPALRSPFMLPLLPWCDRLALGGRGGRDRIAALEGNAVAKLAAEARLGVTHGDAGLLGPVAPDQ